MLDLPVHVRSFIETDTLFCDTLLLDLLHVLASTCTVQFFKSLDQTNSIGNQLQQSKAH